MTTPRRSNFRPAAVLAAVSLLALAPAAFAAAPAGPSTNATVNLIQLLIKQKVITRDAGEALLAQAEAEAAQARAALAAQAPPRAPAPAQTAAAGAGGVAAGAAVASAELPPPAPGTIRVPYIPEAVRDQITAELKEDVIAQAQFEGWAVPKQVPTWVRGVTMSGDIRFRAEGDFYSNNNALEQIDFQQFNAQAPIDINANTNPTGFPLLNTRTNREYMQVRARLGLYAKLSDQVNLGFRIASGTNNSPISTNQILGGGWSKKDVWLDQAFVTLTPNSWVSATFGRFTDPFIVTEMVFDRDINFDGIAATFDAKAAMGDNGDVKLVVGAFPFSFGNPNFPTYQPAKQSGQNRWMLSAQLQGTVTVAEKFDLQGAVAFHDYTGFQGALSEPCALYNGNTQCSTDQLQQPFLRKGNTLFLMRDILPNPASPLNYAQPQVLGLSFNYQLLDISLTAWMPIKDKLGVELQGNYVNNLAYNPSDLCRYDPKGLPVNNITAAAPIAGASASTQQGQAWVNPCHAAPTTVDGTPDGRIASFDGGNQGFWIRGLFGYSKPTKSGEWMVELGYRYLESDAVLDSLTDSDFHLGGTNTQGYWIGGAYAIYKNVTLGGRWMSANSISGPPLAIDTLQIDLQASF